MFYDYNFVPTRRGREKYFLRLNTKPLPNGRYCNVLEKDDGSWLAA